jgi:mannitol 2-dehydrogenase
MTNATPLGAGHGVDAPPYERTGLESSIVHIGVGLFHRAHLAVYLDDLMRQAQGHEWAIRGIGLRPEDATTRDALRAQARSSRMSS